MAEEPVAQSRRPAGLPYEVGVIIGEHDRENADNGEAE